MKILVVYYSLEGNTHRVAEAIARTTGATLLRLRPEHDLSPTGFMRYVRGGRDALRGERPALRPLDQQPGDYDLVFIGTPVWAGTFAPALGTWFASVDLSAKPVAVFCCHDGGKGRVFGKMTDAAKAKRVLGEMEFPKNLRRDAESCERVGRRHCDRRAIRPVTVPRTRLRTGESPRVSRHHRQRATGRRCRTVSNNAWIRSAMRAESDGE